MAQTRRRTPVKRTAKPRARRSTPARARRSSAATLPRPRIPELSPHQLDVLGLALVALGIFLALVLYLGAAGGEVGDAAHDGLRLLLGTVAYVVPPACIVGGGLIVARTLLPATRPLRAGALCLFGALLLGMAAGTLGFDGGVAREQLWDAGTMKARGGAAGELLFWVASQLFSHTGAHILAVFLFVAAL